ncbi:transposase [Candidatus Berkelbacteria bacterium]|nr:transposase [Candidatus Berkelbacteria bacterium]
MVSLLKTYLTGEIYHVYNRGNRKQPIFFSQYDYDRFTRKFVAYAAEHGLTIFSYCLMDNHFHFLVRQDKDGAITRVFLRLCTSHAKFINTKYDLVGSLFQQGFKSKHIIDESHFLHLTRYHHRNAMDILGTTLRVEPEEALQMLRQYPWSSLHQYLGDPARNQLQCSIDEFWEIAQVRPVAYRKFMLEEISRYQRVRASEISGLDP